MGQLLKLLAKGYLSGQLTAGGAGCLPTHWASCFRLPLNFVVLTHPFICVGCCRTSEASFNLLIDGGMLVSGTCDEPHESRYV